RKMLQACEVIDADVVGDRHVALTVGRRVNQGGSASPILVRRVGQENFGHDFFRDGAVKQTSIFFREGIGLGFVREWKNGGRKEDGRGWLRIARGLCEAVVETAATRTGHVRQHAVERDPAIFVGIEAVVEKVSQEASVLRDAFSVNTLNGSDRVASV